MKHEISTEETPEGTITLCPHNNCGFKCCKHNEGNYIVAYPGEFEEAESLGFSLSHLDIIDDNYHGGKKAVCHAKDTSSCDNGYKPLDCKSYPFFPKVEDDSNKAAHILLKGSKCPLTILMIPGHVKYVAKVWRQQIAKNPKIRQWLQKVKLVGYESVELTDGHDRI